MHKSEIANMLNISFSYMHVDYATVPKYISTLVLVKCLHNKITLSSNSVHCLTLATYNPLQTVNLK